MLFSIIQNLELVPSYRRLRKLAEQNQVRITGNEQAGSFTGNAVEGEYQFTGDCLRGKFAGRKVTGEFSWEAGKATITVLGKPFWLPESLLKRKLAEGLDALGNELAREGQDSGNGNS